ncbi:hypothetical protein ASD65_15860 [Microbacterium sp. Root61]|uniref:LuxR C-terminal-related transcriptional regulator n=1 Tax=Microbacterium sp. Root61 TaxID=1736570 RepID=UPI0006FEEFDA|nr:LuxR C-terminal-related transcriptional regulator [Microbacterium sp. Root61]KRA25733.1 hypothetical protein ASD65_15860 [Microbacterium sp. Root61]
MTALATPATGPARAVVVGTAGSGKSTMLRELHRLLSEAPAEASLLVESTEVARVPQDHVLLVDDLHLLGADQIADLRARAEDPDAALVVASRPWPRLDELTLITRPLERTRSAIVLGHVSRSDVLTYLTAGDRVISDSCVDHILHLTGGVSWLVSEALALHDVRDCADDPRHTALGRTLEDRVLHRIDSLPTKLRDEIEALCVAPAPGPRLLDGGAEAIAKGYAEGLLTRNGRPVPLVESSVRASLPVRRLIDLGDVLAADGAGAVDDPDYRRWITGVRDPGFAAALVAHGDRMLESTPRRALDFYDDALRCGAAAGELGGRRAQAAWATGDIDAAGAIIDELSASDAASDGDRIADTSAAVWSMRAMLRTGDAVYQSLPPTSPTSQARATIAAIGSGRAVPPIGRQEALPTTLGVAMELMDRGLRATLRADGTEAAVADLVRASEIYTSSATSAPIPELPAVVAAVVALNTGDLEIAHDVIEDAIRGAQGGDWARPRLLLWRAWLALQRSRPLAAREALDRALECSAARTPRDDLFAQAIRVAIARRYEDAARLEAVWAEVRDTGLHVEVDLYLLQPLTELLTAAARVGDAERMQTHFARALEIVDQLGSPPIWSAHLRWTGVQRGILLNRPSDLKPHAQALLQAAPDSPIAAVMAQAGRVWTACLAGSVDADAVEAAAHGLASAGLGWDGARLAGHGASRSTDRKVAARLLSCARELHPTEGTREPVGVGAADAPALPGSDGTVLSERERDVARLVLQGKTYAEIGETIFISPRTAEHHIAHIRRRLGATSRSDLVAKLRVVVEQSAGGAEHTGVTGDADPSAAARPPS